MTRTHAGTRGNQIQDWAHQMESMLDQFLVRPLSEATGKSPDRFAPSLDIGELENAFVIHVDLPGVKADDVKLEIHDDRLTISGKREALKSSEGKLYHRIERSSGDFFRTILLPQPVDQERIEASYDSGVLNITLPKSIKHQPRKIEIRTGS